MYFQLSAWKLFRWLTWVVVWGGGVTYKQVKIVINKWKRKKKKKKRENSPKKKGRGEGGKMLSLTWIIDDFESFKSTENSVPINGYRDFSTRRVYIIGKKKCHILPESIYQFSIAKEQLPLYTLFLATLILVTKGRRMFNSVEFRYLLRLWPFQCFLTIVVLQRWVEDVVSLWWQLLLPLLVKVM